MIKENNEALTLRDNAKQELMQIKTIESGIEYLNKVKAIEIWAKAEKKDAELQNIIAEQKLRTQRILGKLIKDGQNKGEIVTHQTAKLSSTTQGLDIKKLSDIGINKKQSSTFQQIAEIPQELFEKTITEKKEAVNRAVSELTTAGMVQIAKKEKEQQDRLQRSEKSKNIILKNIDCDFRLGDMNKVLSDIPDNSLDMILTDPPYPYEFIKCWSDLSLFASKKLKGGGFCVAYSGNLFLPEVIKRMSEHLNWYWLCGLIHEGKTRQNFESNLFSRMKPILIYYKGEKIKQKNWHDDLFISPKADKTQHGWGQSIQPVIEILKVFEPKIVCDPFTGGGTTLIACKKLNIKFVGSEINEVTYNITKGRINDSSGS